MAHSGTATVYDDTGEYPSLPYQPDAMSANVPYDTLWSYRSRYVWYGVYAFL